MGGGGEILKVVVDGEGRHSIWPADRPLPSGWLATGFTGPKATCLGHIDGVWRDMRPLSLQRRMARDDAQRSPGPMATGG